VQGTANIPAPGIGTLWFVLEAELRPKNNDFGISKSLTLIYDFVYSR